MTEMDTTLRWEQQTTSGPAPSAPAVEKPESTLITEQQVLFGSAAAVAVPRARRRRWTHAVASALQGFLDGPQDPTKRNRPKRHRYLENALMAREMDRL